MTLPVFFFEILLSHLEFFNTFGYTSLQYIDFKINKKKHKGRLAVEALFATLRGLGAVRLAAMAAVFVAVGGFLIVTISRLTAPEMALLYGNLDISEGAQIVSRLEGMDVPIELKGGGTQIYVPADQVARLRMNMAEVGLPSGGSIGYEIFDRSDVLGSTSFVQDVNLLRALEGELSRTIRSIQNVAAARVHIVLPKRELFSREKQLPTASVVLKMRGGSKLTNAQVQAIQNLVAFSVPGLLSEQISIVDDKGNLLARGEGKEVGSMSGLPPGVEEARLAYEANVSRMVESLLEKSLGAGKVRAEVSVEMDLQRLTEQSETYDPDGQVIRSTQSSSDTESSQNGSNTATTVQNNLPNLASGNQGGGTRSDGKKAEETVNYEISKIVKTQVKELGGIKRVSVAVLVDGTYQTGDANQETYIPRGTEELQQITKLVKAAVGFKADRGDTIEVVNLRFSTDRGDDFSLADNMIMGLERKEFIDVMQIGIFALVILVVFLFVIKPLMRRAIDVRGAPATAGVANGNVGPTDGEIGTSTNLDHTGVSHGEGISEEERVEAPHEQIVGTMKVITLKQIEGLIDEHPEEAVMLLRTWMKNV